MAPFGRLMTAMITPMAPDGAVNYDGAAKLAAHLVDDMRNEGLVVNGTTGEAPTTTDEEKARLIRVVLDAVGDRAKVVAGVGTNITTHTITDSAVLRRVLAEVRKTGIAVSDRQIDIDTYSVGAPVTGPDGWCVAALSVVVSYDDPGRSSWGPAVRAAAIGISRRLRASG